MDPPETGITRSPTELGGPITVSFYQNTDRTSTGNRRKTRPYLARFQCQHAREGVDLPVMPQCPAQPMQGYFGYTGLAQKPMLLGPWLLARPRRVKYLLCCTKRRPSCPRYYSQAIPEYRLQSHPDFGRIS